MQKVLTQVESLLRDQRRQAFSLIDIGAQLLEMKQLITYELFNKTVYGGKTKLAQEMVRLLTHPTNHERGNDPIPTRLHLR